MIADKGNLTQDNCCFRVANMCSCRWSGGMSGLSDADAARRSGADNGRTRADGASRSAMVWICPWSILNDRSGRRRSGPVSLSRYELEEILKCPTAHRIRPRSSLAPGAFCVWPTSKELQFPLRKAAWIRLHVVRPVVCRAVRLPVCALGRRRRRWPSLTAVSRTARARGEDQG